MPEAAAWQPLQCQAPVRTSHRGTAARTAPAYLEAPARAHACGQQALTCVHHAEARWANLCSMALVQISSAADPGMQGGNRAACSHKTTCLRIRPVSQSTMHINHTGAPKQGREGQAWCARNMNRISCVSMVERAAPKQILGPQRINRCRQAAGRPPWMHRRTACALLSTTVAPSGRKSSRPRRLPRPNSSGAPPPTRSQATCARRPCSHVMIVPWGVCAANSRSFSCRA